LKVPNEENYYLNDILRSKEFKDFSKKYGVSRENILNFYATNKAFVMELQKERTITFENRKEPDSPAMNEGSQKKEDGGEKNG
jgi:hypothetical protein